MILPFPIRIISKNVHTCTKSLWETLDWPSLWYQTSKSCSTRVLGMKLMFKTFGCGSLCSTKKSTINGNVGLKMYTKSEGWDVNFGGFSVNVSSNFLLQKNCQNFVETTENQRKKIIRNENAVSIISVATLRDYSFSFLWLVVSYISSFLCIIYAYLLFSHEYHILLINSI